MKTIYSRDCCFCPTCGNLEYQHQWAAIASEQLALYYCYPCRRSFMIHITCSQNQELDQETAVQWQQQKRQTGNWRVGLDDCEAPLSLYSVIGEIDGDHDLYPLIQEGGHHCSECLRLFEGIE